MTNKQHTLSTNSQLFNHILPVSIGFDRLLTEFANTSSVPNSYPPHNIVKVNETTFRVEFALAGFRKEDIQIIKERDTLKIEGESVSNLEEGEIYVHQGIANRQFKKSFKLAEHAQVTEAEFTDGILSITVVLVVPEHEKPQAIDIS